MNSNNPVITGALIGAPIGLTLAWYLFNTSPWYHNLVVDSWTNPYMWAMSVPFGVGLFFWNISHK